MYMKIVGGRCFNISGFGWDHVDSSVDIGYNSPGAKLENGGLPYTESPLSFDGFN